MSKKIAMKKIATKVSQDKDGCLRVATPEGVCGMPDAGTATMALLKQALGTASALIKSPVEKTEQALGLIEGIKPADAIEGMLAVQMTALHNMSMECARRAMLEEQTFEGMDMNMRHAARLVPRQLLCPVGDN